MLRRVCSCLRHLLLAPALPCCCSAPDAMFVCNVLSAFRPAPHAASALGGWGLPRCFPCRLLVLQDHYPRYSSDRATLTDLSQTNHTDHRHSSCAGHEPVCLVLAWASSTACALLEFAEAPTHILRVPYSVDIGITTITSPALDTAALCLSSWPAAISAQMPTLVSITISSQHYSYNVSADSRLYL